MPYWLMKSEPDEFSIDDLKHKGKARWDGVRNYQARNFMREMALGDSVFFYHSSCKEVGISGIMKIVGTHYEDPLAVDPTSDYFDEKSLKANRWSAVDVVFDSKLSKIFPLDQIKKLADHDQRLADFALVKKGSRLSVMPVTDAQWQCLMEKIAPLVIK